MMKRVLTIIVSLAIFGLGFIPYQTILVPEWRVRVQDEKGEPYVNEMIRQFCRDYSLMISDGGTQYTNEDGIVEFPEKTIHLSFYSRLLRSTWSLILLLAHGSFGTDIYLDATGPEGLQRLEYLGGTPPSKFILRSKQDE